MRCPRCGAEMRPLLTGVYCPNDCDRAPGVTATEAWYRMLLKVDPAFRGPLATLVEVTSQKHAIHILILGRAKGRTRLEVGDLDFSLACSAFTIIELGETDRHPFVIKNYHGGLHLSEVPDWEDR